MYEGQLGALEDLVRSTTSGRQGMPPANGMLHLWRYIRRITAQKLSTNSFFGALNPGQRLESIAYENDIPIIQCLLI